MISALSKSTIRTLIPAGLYEPEVAGVRARDCGVGIDEFVLSAVPATVGDEIGVGELDGSKKMCRGSRSRWRIPRVWRAVYAQRTRSLRWLLSTMASYKENEG